MDARDDEGNVLSMSLEQAITDVLSRSTDPIDSKLVFMMTILNSLFDEVYQQV